MPQRHTSGEFLTLHAPQESLIPYGGGDVRRRQAGKGIGAGGGQRRAEADGSSLETVSVALRLYRCVEWCRR